MPYIDAIVVSPAPLDDDQLLTLQDHIGTLFRLSSENEFELLERGPFHRFRDRHAYQFTWSDTATDMLDLIDYDTMDALDAVAKTANVALVFWLPDNGGPVNDGHNHVAFNDPDDVARQFAYALQVINDLTSYNYDWAAPIILSGIHLLDAMNHYKVG